MKYDDGQTSVNVSQRRMQPVQGVERFTFIIIMEGDVVL